ncbi:hypothetical protein ACJX0J_018427 [Zea mays]
MGIFEASTSVAAQTLDFIFLLFITFQIHSVVTAHKIKGISMNLLLNIFKQENPALVYNLYIKRKYSLDKTPNKHLSDVYMEPIDPFGASSYCHQEETDKRIHTADAAVGTRDEGGEGDQYGAREASVFGYMRKRERWMDGWLGSSNNNAGEAPDGAAAAAANPIIKKGTLLIYVCTMWNLLLRNSSSNKMTRWWTHMILVCNNDYNTKD